MFRALTRFWAVAIILLLGGHSGFGFALLGRPPAAGGGDAYQTPALFYNLATDIGTPKSLGEGYRWNTRNLFYACDANFFNFFGADGLKAIDQAFAIMNNLTNVSRYSPDLSEWPLNTSRINHRAEAVSLLDLKSFTLHLLVEQMGLAEPDRWTWCLRTRTVGPPPGCPIEMLYDVIKRNYDPVTYEPSSYVNGTLYSYAILENCTGANLADAVEFAVDPAAETLTAVAAFNAGNGQFYTGLTRDDVGGFRYQWATNRMYVEGVSPDSILQVSTTPTLIVTSNLASLVAATLTNNSNQLQALFPTIQITSANFQYFSNIVTTNIVAFFTNLNGSPVGSPATLVQTVTLTTNFNIPIFTYTFGNVITNFVYTNFGVPVTNQPGNQGFVTVQQTVVSLPNGAPLGSPLQTNTFSSTSLSNFVTGEFFIIPANACGYTILSNVQTQVTAVTNVVATTTGAANAGSFSIVTFFTNHTLAVAIPGCIPNSVALREGVEKVSFFNTAFDSYLGTTFAPITNTYTLTAVTAATNGVAFPQNFYRVAVQPDFLITAQDTTGVSLTGIRTVSYNATNIGTGLAGPGNINAPVTFIYNKVGPIFQVPAGGLGSFVPPFGEFNSTLIFQWGSYDGTTNQPIVFPSGSSILNLENNVFLQITISGPLAVGHVNQPYSAQLTAAGAAPFAWAPATSIFYPGGLPPGLNLSPTTGLISGTPTATGLYDFLVQVSDAAGRVNQSHLQIEIDP